MTREERNQLVNDFKYSKLNAPDVVRRFLQKCRFGIRKPLFYPLNYGNSDIGDFRFAIADCNRTRARTCFQSDRAIPRGHSQD
jgi:hypothetical protein